jgi:hypothetical protein
LRVEGNLDVPRLARTEKGKNGKVLLQVSAGFRLTAAAKPGVEFGPGKVIIAYAAAAKRKWTRSTKLAMASDKDAR